MEERNPTPPSHRTQSDRLFESVGGSERHPTPPSHPCWVSPNLLFGAIAYLSRLGGPNATPHHHLTLMVAGYIAYLSRLGGVREPNTTVSPLLGFTQPTQIYRLKKLLYMSARFPII
ncbi:hypothetical protein [Limnospira platensis]|uniref:hypothetical protein n=1 Tax=Limnospira platensis TaxID=118562 RepID=UPI00028041C1|nr:hypothetical protein SPLC1_S051920 [Arthrospira platensis C1]UWU50487.1 hypothetical protein APLC1_5404 [Arthrospira platensis C1]